MLKGIIVSNDEDGAHKIRKVLDKLNLKEVKFKSAKKMKGSMCLVDTRNVDMVMISLNEGNESEMEERVPGLINNITRQEDDLVTLNVNNCARYISKERIIYMEVVDRDVYVYTAKHSYPVYRHTMKEILEQINDPYFVRCHKSYAMNVRHMEDVSKERRYLWKPYFKHMENHQCVISETYYDNVMKIYEKWVRHEENDY